jgi:hypothetical protein
VLTLILIYIFFAAVVWGLEKWLHRPLFIRRYGHHFRWKLNCRFSDWALQDWLALSVIMFCAVIFLPKMWTFEERDTADLLTYWGFAAFSVSSVWLLVENLGLAPWYKAHAGLLTVLAALSTFGLGLISSAYADSYILALTRVDAAHFVIAQKMVAFVLLVCFWTMAGATLGVITMLASYVYFCAVDSDFHRKLRKHRVHQMAYRSYRRDSEERRRVVLRIITFFGAITTMYVLTILTSNSLARSSPALSQVLVFGSFHLAPSDCGMKAVSSDSRIALVEGSQAVIATPSNHGYRFTSGICKILSEDEAAAFKADQVRKSVSADNYL